MKTPIVLVFIACFCAPTLGCAQNATVRVRPSPADSFVDAVGVDSHFDYAGTPYTDRWTTVSAALIASGIRHIRDGDNPADPIYLDRLRDLGQRGVRHSASFEVTAQPERIVATLRTYAPYVDFAEPQNEYDSTAGVDPHWNERIVQEQQVLYATVRAHSEFARVAVIGPALEQQRLYSELGPLDAYEDAANLHNATCNQNPGTPSFRGIAAMTRLVRDSTPSKPIWTTETGYNDDPARPCAIPDDAIAKYDPRTVAERFNAGEPRVYFYQLANMPSDAVFGGMGLLDDEGDPKPQFRAVASLIAHLADPGPKFRVSPIGLSIASPVDDVHHTLLEKRDGTYELLLWREVPCWQTGSPRNVGGTRIVVDPVTIDVTTPFATSVRYFRYDESSWRLHAVDPGPVADGRIRVPVSDAISILEFKTSGSTKALSRPN